MVELLVLLVVVILASAAETLHAARVRRVAALAFGPRRRPARWARLAGPLRVIALGAVAWGLTTLLMLSPKVHRNADEPAEHELRHLLLVLDVSPSMRLQDAGMEGNQSRMQRARDLLGSLFSRIAVRQYRISVIAVYNGALPVVEQTRDAEVVRNILDDLPMHHAFKPGDTDLFAGLKEAARVARPWPPRSTTLIVMSDGDTVPSTGMPQMPASVENCLVVGVGNPRHGSFIDGRQSKQDISTLRKLAARLNGVYHDGNEKHLGSDIVYSISQAGTAGPLERLTRREYAIVACAVGSLVLAWLPILLQRFGTHWTPGVPARTVVHSRLNGTTKSGNLAAEPPTVASH